VHTKKTQKLLNTAQLSREQFVPSRDGLCS